MSCRIMCTLLVGATFAVGAFASPTKQHNDPSPAHLKMGRHDPAFRSGYDDGYRQGANDAESVALAYTDESGQAYDQALDGYTSGYGDQVTYQRRFRRGYIAGYKAGWDFFSGQYTPLGAGGW